MWTMLGDHQDGRRLTYLSPAKTTYWVAPIMRVRKDGSGVAGAVMASEVWLPRLFAKAVNDKS